MTIRVESLVAPISFTDFLDQHRLEVVVHERPRGDMRRLNLERYYASIPNGEVSEPRVLVGKSGNGDTVAEAVADYAAQLAGEVLVIDAYTPQRREIQCPNEWLPEEIDA